MDYEPDDSGRSIRFFDVLVTLVLSGVVFAQVEIWRTLHPDVPAAPVAPQGPLAAVPAQAVVARPARVAAAPARVYFGKPKVLRKAIHLPGGKARYEKPRDEFVSEVNPAEVPGG